MAQPSGVAKQMLVYTVRLPCRRSWVRVPSSAPKIPGNRGFLFRIETTRVPDESQRVDSKLHLPNGGCPGSSFPWSGRSGLLVRPAQAEIPVASIVNDLGLGLLVPDCVLAERVPVRLCREQRRRTLVRLRRVARRQPRWAMAIALRAAVGSSVGVPFAESAGPQDSGSARPRGLLRAVAQSRGGDGSCL